MPPTLQILTYCTTGAAFLVGRSAACALATATMPAAEPSRRLLMSVIVDLQLTLWALVLRTLDLGGPLANPINRRWSAPSSRCFRTLAVPLEWPPRPVRDRDSPVHTLHHTLLSPPLNSNPSQKRLGNAFPETLLHKGHEIGRERSFSSPLVASPRG